MNFNPLTRSKSIDIQENHSTSILQSIDKFLFCNLFANIIAPNVALIDIKDTSNSMIITSILNIIINTKDYSNEYIIETILNSHPKIIKNIIKIVNCSSSGAILNLEITDYKVRSILGIKQYVDLTSEPHQHVQSSSKSQIQLLYLLYNESDDRLKEMYINNQFAHQYFTYLCNSYKPGHYKVKCRVMILPEELSDNNVVNLLKIITKCKGNSDVIEKVRDYAKKCTIKITEEELAAALAIRAASKSFNINYEVLKECKNIVNTTPLAKDNAGNDNCDGPNKDIVSCSQTIKIPSKDVQLKTYQQPNKIQDNKIAVNAVIEDGNKVHLSATDHSVSDFNTPQVPANIEMVGYSNLAFDHHLDDY